MFHFVKIQENSDSLIDLLVAQCADLERLLALAFAQSEAVERGDFNEVMRITNERATLSERLEIFGQRVAELRARLGDAADSILRNPVAARTSKLVTEVLAQDKQMRPIFEAARETAAAGIIKINQAQRCSGAYAQKSSKGLAYDLSA